MNRDAYTVYNRSIASLPIGCQNKDPCDLKPVDIAGVDEQLKYSSAP